MKYLALVLLLLPDAVYAGFYQYVFRDSTDHSVNCYLKVIPETGPVRGLIIRDFSSLPDTSKANPYRFEALAEEQGLLTVYTLTSKYYPEMYYSDTCMYLLDEIVAEVIREHRVPTGNIFAGGISASGTRALRYAQFCAAGKSKYGHRVKGVFSVDSPLDLTRFYRSVQYNHSNFKDGMRWEAELMSRVFPEKLGGSPDEFPEKYRDASVFCATDSLGGNVHLLREVNLILFHEPDLDWWMEERGAGLYDINSVDLVGMTLRLRSMGSNKVTLITTSGKGYDRNGNRNCHSWTIVDEELLIRWICELID